MAKRFVKVYSQGVVGHGMDIYVDRETGVNYLYAWGNGVALTPLLDREGKPIITPTSNLEE